MSLGRVMLDVAGTELTPEDREILQHPQVAGVILFARNFVDQAALKALCQSIRELRDPRLLITVDQEGGRVQRFKEEFTLLPASGQIGQCYNNNPDEGVLAAEMAGFLMAVECLEVGVDFSFAPVLDLDRGLCAVVGDRSFHKNPEVVVKLASSYIQGMQRAGMQAVGKHFPGHGAVTTDTHVGIAMDERSFEAIESEDLVPFKALGPQLAGLMPAHVMYPDVDERPAGFSDFWIQRVLREQLGFEGVVFSDDLSMEGASVGGDYITRSLCALEAGCDILLCCNDRANTAVLLDNLQHPVTRDLQNLYGVLRAQDAQLKQAKETLQSLNLI